MSKFKPLGDRVLIKVDVPKENVTKGGLYIPKDEEHLNRPTEGEVVSIGAGVELKGLEVGQRVFMQKYQYENIDIDGEDYVIVDSKFILAVLG